MKNTMKPYNIIIFVFFSLLVNPILLYPLYAQESQEEEIRERYKILSDSTKIKMIDYEEDGASEKPSLDPSDKAIEFDQSYQKIFEADSIPRIEQPAIPEQDRLADPSASRSAPDDSIVVKFKFTESLIANNLVVRAGVNFSQLFVSDNRRNVSSLLGATVGVESYFPATNKVDIIFGSLFRQAGFNHELYNVSFRSNYLDIPLIASYRLPPLQEKISLYLGYTSSFLLYKTQNGDYPEQLFERPVPYIYGRQDDFQYDINAQSIFDFAFNWGLKFESNKLHIEFRAYHSHIALFPNRSEMYNSLTFTLGYYPFR